VSATLALCEALIERASVTPDDAGCQQLIVQRLLPLGFTAEWFLCGDVTNVLLTRGEGSPCTWLLGHTDVVPAGNPDGWASPPFSAQVRDGKLFGRGACDMKGAVAAMVVALEAFAANPAPGQGQVGLLLTSDEEGVAVDGIRRVAGVLKGRGQRADHCLVGEPSSAQQLGDSVRVGRRGSIVATLTVRGVQGHTAFPHTIDNPVHRLAPFLSELVSTHWDGGTAADAGGFPPTHCQVSNFNAGIGALQVTPPEAVLKVSFRNNPLSPSADLKARFEAMLEAHDISNFELDWWVSGEPFYSQPGPLRDAVVAAVEAVAGITPDLNTGGGTSDGRFIAPLGSEVVELGLVNASIHKVDEHCAVADLDRLQAMYLQVLQRLHGATARR
jgi:succinyl-diaminopimelate desuccinylase